MSDILVAKDQLKSIIERVERLHEERKVISDDISDVYGEAKANGFDVKVLKHIVKIRGQDLASREEFETVCDLYMHSLGMLPDHEIDGNPRVDIPNPYDRQIGCKNTDDLPKIVEENSKVYAIKNNENDRIKIGVSRNVEARLSQLKKASGADLLLLKTVDGSYKLEADFHAKLNAFKVFGEWFSGSSDCIEIIDELFSSHSDDFYAGAGAQ